MAVLHAAVKEAKLKRCRAKGKTNKLLVCMEMIVGLARELGNASVGPRHEVATRLATKPDFVDCLGFTQGKIWAAVGPRWGLFIGLQKELRLGLILG